MGYSEEELEQLIEDASQRGKPDLVKFYKGMLEETRASTID